MSACPRLDQVIGDGGCERTGARGTAAGARCHGLGERVWESEESPTKPLCGRRRGPVRPPCIRETLSKAEQSDREPESISIGLKYNACTPRKDCWAGRGGVAWRTVLPAKDALHRAQSTAEGPRAAAVAESPSVSAASAAPAAAEAPPAASAAAARAERSQSRRTAAGAACSAEPRDTHSFHSCVMYSYSCECRETMHTTTEAVVEISNANAPRGRRRGGQRAQAAGENPQAQTRQRRRRRRRPRGNGRLSPS